MPKSKFWKMHKVKNSAELTLYGDIANESWWEDDVTPKQMSDELAAMGDVSDITVRINSGGGDVFAGVAIHSMLKRHPANITVYIDGLAASIASIIAMAGDKIIMPKGSMLMIHNPWSFTAGDSSDFRKMADTLDTIRESMIPIYVEKTGLNSEEIISLLDSETWLTAEEAVNKGFATDVEDSVKVAASIRGKNTVVNGIKMDLSRFKNAPTPTVAPETEDNDDDEGAPLYDVGDDIQITIPPRKAGQSNGVVREAMLTYCYGILFDGEDEIYHWYTESELKGVPESEESSTQNRTKQKTQGRNLDLELKNIKLINLSN